MPEVKTAYYEPTVKILEYIAKHPSQTMRQILAGLEGKVSELEFSMAEAVLDGCMVLSHTWIRDAEKRFHTAYAITPGMNINQIKKELEKVLPRKK